MERYTMIILPLQLFEISKWPVPKQDIQRVVLIEDDYYFTRLPFHKQKIAYQRACMKEYASELKEKLSHVVVKYVNSKDAGVACYQDLNQRYGAKLVYFDPVDKKVQNHLKRHLPTAKILPTLNYWLTAEEMPLFRRKTRYSFDSFYQYQKEKLVQMFERRSDFGLSKSKSQDKYNRNRIDKDQVPTKSIQTIQQDEITREAIAYVERNFKDNYGTLQGGRIWYPFTRKQALAWLKHFLAQKLHNFGPYQDAIDTENPFLYHSVISPMLNVGLLTDTVVIDTLLSFLYSSPVKIPIQSLEAFVRQVIGWRNYVYLIYVQEDQSLYKDNQLKHTNKLNNRIWTSNTGIQAIDKHLQILEKTAYLSHIPRLMVIGNFMLLLQLDPVQVLDWFTTMFIDSCDTLMVPNIIMSQYNSKIMMTRMYISSFNYIQTMSNEKYPESDRDAWNALFNAFLLNHSKFGLSSYVYASTTRKLLDLPDAQKRAIKQDAKTIIQRYTR